MLTKLMIKQCIQLNDWLFSSENFTNRWLDPKAHFEIHNNWNRCDKDSILWDYFCIFPSLTAIVSTNTLDELGWAINNQLDLVADNAALSDALANKEPKGDFSSDQCVQPSFLQIKKKIKYNTILQYGMNTLTGTVFHFPVAADDIMFWIPCVIFGMSAGEGGVSSTLA